MFRFRRYRVFVITAFILLILLFQLGRNSNWEPTASLPHAKDTHAKDSGSKNKETNIRPPKYQLPNDKASPDGADAYRGATPDEPQRQPPKKEQNIEIPVLKEDYGYQHYAPPPVTSVKTPAKNTGAKAGKPATSTTAAPKPTKAPSSNDKLIVDEEPYTAPKKLSKTAVHWVKPTEYFPVPTESLIRLPTGKPKPIPSIQALFPPESPATKEKREKRLAKVKAEAERAWGGYKKYAWTHDEVRPVSKKARDPFCGWAATMVDSLDTLWIMGMTAEFDEAVEAVREIDFTTTPHRTDIPVFETIIRYLGGLLAAYDVSGGHNGRYKVLLDKALELAEILMGVFDTPNRMPVLYYNWKPDYANQPHRASSGSSVAELGSMSMEFTRLAQLTGEDRFYDAVARITDAFEEWQQRGTALDGIFPTNVDASGCNRTALNLQLAEEKSRAAREQERLEAEKEEEDEPVGYEPREVADEKDEAVLKKRATIDKRSSSGPAFDSPGLARRSPPVKASGALAEWECPAQGLVSGGYGTDSYSMGGSQDSAYEYFPKQYLLLGGLEPKYRTMHEKTVKAVKKYLLYRPMIKDEGRELLFSAKAYAYHGDDQSLTYDYEITHLTCFLGGMFGLGGKIFGSEEDVEIGKKLADGCAWAYEVMPTGIMPETSFVMPCKSVEKCPWNETAWHEKMDPNHKWREEQMADYLERHKAWEEEVKEIKEAANLKKKQAGTKGGQTVADKAIETDKVASVHKRSAEDASDSILDRNRKTMEDSEAVEKIGEELDFNSPSSHKTGGHQGYAGSSDGSQTPLTDEFELPPEPIPPQTHEEYVKERIANDRLPPGFTSLNDKRYILRPEAIESVWYMYRITGDPVWQEKGWRMFESVIAATSVAEGHSAIDDVTTDKAATYMDNMESFWLAETLKYFYLLFATPDVVSLDEWVFNTEAHPFRRPS
ncbi:glycosyl hydrolase family 47-domain-containing protein [Coniochaeta sp. 2T2.1]|nr:glycosyl hydrolase family 47-domain-containing protein [Coniochaeta sp. 2T2.1]